MRPVLSPAEVLGLSGAALEGRVRSASHHVPDIVFARLADRLRADALSQRLIYEHDGVEEAIRIMLRPLLVMPEQLSYVHHVCLQLIEALKRLPGFYREDERWVLTDARGPSASLHLTSLGIDLPLAEVYLKVAFPPDAEPQGPGPLTPQDAERDARSC